MRWVNKLERTICYRKNKLTSGLHGSHDGPTWTECRLYPLPFMRLSCHWQYFRLKLSLKVGRLRIYSVFASLIHSYFDNVKSELIRSLFAFHYCVYSFTFDNVTRNFFIDNMADAWKTFFERSPFFTQTLFILLYPDRHAQEYVPWSFKHSSLALHRVSSWEHSSTSETNHTKYRLISSKQPSTVLTADCCHATYHLVSQFSISSDIIC